MHERNTAERLLEMYRVVQKSLDTAGKMLIEIY